MTNTIYDLLWSNEEKKALTLSEQNENVLNEFVRAIAELASNENIRQRLNDKQQIFDKFVKDAKQFATELARYNLLLKDKAMKYDANADYARTMELMPEVVNTLTNTVRIIPQIESLPQHIVENQLKNSLTTLSNKYEVMKSRADSLSKTGVGAFQMFLGSLITIISCLIPAPLLGCMGGIALSFGVKDFLNNHDMQKNRVTDAYSSFAKTSNGLFKFAPQSPPAETKNQPASVDGELYRPIYPQLAT